MRADALTACRAQLDDLAREAVRDGGGKDVFVHVSALDRAGITGLNEGQRVFVGVAEGRKGPEAASIQVA